LVLVLELVEKFVVLGFVELVVKFTVLGFVELVVKFVVLGFVELVVKFAVLGFVALDRSVRQDLHAVLLAKFKSPQMEQRQSPGFILYAIIIIRTFVFFC
jgi:hypothetical protein